MSRSKPRGYWEYRGHWLTKASGSDSFYACWYDSERAQRTGKTRRKSLKTADIEEAKDRLVAFVLSRETYHEDALILSVLHRYYEEVARDLPSQPQAKRTLALFKEVLDGPERISDLTEGFQVDRILKPWLARHGHAAKYLSRNMSMLTAAMRHCRIPNPPKIIYDPNTLAKMLRIVPPKMGRWFPRSDDDLARFLDNLTSDAAFRIAMIMLNTGCRPEVAIDLGLDQADFDNMLIDLNPRGRLETPTKRRPSLRLTETQPAGWRPGTRG